VLLKHGTSNVRRHKVSQRRLSKAKVRKGDGHSNLPPATRAKSYQPPREKSISAMAVQAGRDDP
jgi:hypothetical protein